MTEAGGTTYPLEKTADVVGVFTKLQTPPPFLKILHVLTASSESGMKIYALCEVEAGKESEGLKEITKRQSDFLNIEDYNYLTEAVLPAEKVIPLLRL